LRVDTVETMIYLKVVPFFEYFYKILFLQISELFNQRGSFIGIVSIIFFRSFFFRCVFGADLSMFCWIGNKRKFFVPHVYEICVMWTGELLILLGMRYAIFMEHQFFERVFIGIFHFKLFLFATCIKGKGWPKPTYIKNTIYFLKQ